jgi:nucleotide-binding universal stress UspA family protein
MAPYMDAAPFSTAYEPITVAREAHRSHRAPQRIVVGVDGSPTSRAAIRWAAAYAQPQDVIALVHVWSAPPPAATVATAKEEAADLAWALVDREHARADLLPYPDGVTILGTAVEGEPRRRLAELDCDLLVIGNRGHSSLTDAGWGSVPTYLARHAGAPVVVVPYEASP